MQMMAKKRIPGEPQIEKILTGTAERIESTSDDPHRLGTFSFFYFAFVVLIAQYSLLLSFNKVTMRRFTLFCRVSSDVSCRPSSPNLSSMTHRSMRVGAQPHPFDPRPRTVPDLSHLRACFPRSTDHDQLAPPAHRNQR